MSKSKHTEAQIIGALKQVEAGRTAEDVAREQGVSKHTIYALTSLAYNFGGGSLERSTLLKLLNEGDYKGAADQFPLWDHAAGKVSDGLLKRREAERVLFFAAI